MRPPPPLTLLSWLALAACGGRDATSDASRDSSQTDGGSDAAGDTSTDEPRTDAADDATGDTAGDTLVDGPMCPMTFPDGWPCTEEGQECAWGAICPAGGREYECECKPTPGDVAGARARWMCTVCAASDGGASDVAGSCAVPKDISISIPYSMAYAGKVTEVNPDAIQIIAGDTGLTFPWFGPAADSAFLVDDDVTFEKTAMSGFAPQWLVLKGPHGTAALYHEMNFTSMGTPPTYPGLPTLEFANRCSTAMGACAPSTVKNVVASAPGGGGLASVGPGETSTVAGFQVTNGHVVQYPVCGGAEAYFHAVVSLLGPP